jgi:DNA repair protein RadD
MLELRDYQRAAIDALYKYWADGGGNGLIVLPTGAGKALVIAKIIEELLADYPDLRIANITHSKTLVEQNFKEFIGLSPFAPAGLYSAGLGRKDTRAQIIFGGIQSIYNKTKEVGAIDLVMVDEAHAISRKSDSQYGIFFDGVLEHNPDSRVCGLTATDFRLDSGRLTEGDDRLFHDVVYEIGIGELIAKDYLAPLSSKTGSIVIDTAGVGKRGGEFIAGELERAADKDEITEGAVAEAIARGGDRRAALFFCSGQDHSEHVRDELRRQGRTAESLTSRVPAAEQTRIIRDFKEGRVWALCSANMLTTGFNVPHVDLISMLRPTASTGLYVQMLGRGTRKAYGKTNCLVLDHSGNVAKHGPVDMVRPKTPGKGDGTPPQKICPVDIPDETGRYGCEEILLISIMTCPCCGYIFPPNEEEKITARADDKPVLSSEKPWSPVKSRKFFHHPGKAGKPDTVKVAYMVGFKTVNEWLCPAHEGFAKSRAQRYWRDHGGKMPFPKDVLEWLGRQDELQGTAEVQLDYGRDHRYPDVKAYRVQPVADNDNTPAAANDNGPAWAWEDSIPF